MEFVGGVAGGAGAEAELGEEEGGGVAEAEGGDRESRAEVVDEEGGFGKEKLLDGEREGKTARTASGGGGGKAAEPTTGPVEADLGDTAEEDFWGKAESEGVDPEGVAVMDPTDLEKGEVEPAGGGDGGGTSRQEQDSAEGERRKGDAE